MSEEIKIPEDMRCRDKLKEKLGIDCGAVVSIRDLLILLGKPDSKNAI